MQGPPRKPESEVEWVVDAIFLASSEAKHFRFLGFFPSWFFMLSSCLFGCYTLILHQIMHLTLQVGRFSVFIQHCGSHWCQASHSKSWIAHLRKVVNGPCPAWYIDALHGTASQIPEMTLENRTSCCEGLRSMLVRDSVTHREWNWETWLSCQLTQNLPNCFKLQFESGWKEACKHSSNQSQYSHIILFVVLDM